MIGKNYPLNALRAFEASARSLSFVSAASELHVTPAAISHQVKKLEQYLDIQLFRRLTKGLVLTNSGQRLQSELHVVFQQLDQVMSRISIRPSRNPLTLSAAPIFAVKWLVPRLQEFNQLHPEIDLQISSSLEIIDFKKNTFDAAIRLGNGPYHHLNAILLFEESVIPMCSPQLLSTTRPLRNAHDLAAHVLLHNDSTAFDSEMPTWEKWLANAGAQDVDASRGLRFSQPDHALQAAIDGAGVVLGWQYLAQDDLQKGNLIAPLEHTMPLNRAFYLVYPNNKNNQQNLTKFQNWMMDKLRKKSTV